MIPDDVYVHQTIEGDAEAFNELVARHHATIYRLAYRILKGNLEDAADATQDTFLEAYRSIKTFQFQSKFSTWLYRIGINMCQQYIRKSKADERRRTAYAQEMEFSNSISEDMSPEQEVLKIEQREIIQDAINKLPPAQREVVTLHYLQHLKYREIAVVLGCSEGTVASRLNQGLKNLKRKLSKYYV